MTELQKKAIEIVPGFKKQEFSSTHQCYYCLGTIDKKRTTIVVANQDKKNTFTKKAYFHVFCFRCYMEEILTS